MPMALSLQSTFRDIDIGIYVKNPAENPFVISSDITTHLSLLAKKEGLIFTPLESPAACSGDEDIIPFRANTGFYAPCEPPRWKVKDFLTGFTADDFDVRIINDAPFTPLEIMPRSVSSRNDWNF